LFKRPSRVLDIARRNKPTGSLWYYNTIHYNRPTKICNAHIVCQLAQSEARADTGGTWQG